MGAGEPVWGTKSVAEMEAGAGIFSGWDEGLKRAAIMITRIMMPPMMIQGRRDLFAIS
jgi:hypothetical protein